MSSRSGLQTLEVTILHVAESESFLCHPFFCFWNTLEIGERVRYDEVSVQHASAELKKASSCGQGGLPDAFGKCGGEKKTCKLNLMSPAKAMSCDYRADLSVY